MSRLICVVHDYDGLYGRFWGRLGDICSPTEFLRNPGSCDLVCFTGGEDVSPSLYHHENLASHCNPIRDRGEEMIFKVAQKHQIPMTGICRGSQFLNVMCGGTMVQHLKRSHGGNHHLCYTYDGEEFEVTSSHHQMSVPGPEGVLLARAEVELDPQDLVYGGSFRDLAELYTEEGRLQITEAFAYPKVRVFAVQHHPEWQRKPDEQEAPAWTLRKIREFCWEEKAETFSA